MSLVIGLEGEQSSAFPSPDTLAQGIYDGLPKEWYDFQEDDDDYRITTISAPSDEYQHELIRSKATVKIRDHQIEVLAAELKQERKLTAHLEANVANLVEKNDNQAVVILSQQKDNGRQASDLLALQAKYDESLLDWKSIQKQRDDAIHRADRNWDRITMLVGEVKTLQGVNKTLIEQCDRRDDDLKGCQKANREYTGMNRAQGEAISKVIAAMQTLGYTFVFNETFGELEAALDSAKSYLSEASVELDNIKTER